MDSSGKQNARYLISKFINTYELDLRSLALFRMGLSLGILNKVTISAWNIQPQNINSISQSNSIITNTIFQAWSMIRDHLTNFPLIQSFLLLLGGLTAANLFIGHRTRLMTFLCWLTTIALYPPSSLLSLYGHGFSSGLLFWSIFLPLGGSYAVDRALHPLGNSLPQRIFSGGTLAFTLQVGFLYLFAILSNTPLINTNANIFFVVFLVISVLLLIIPIYTHILRTCTFYLLFALAIIDTDTLSINWYVLSLSLFVFIPSQAWDFVCTRLYTPQRTNLQIYYDADCGFCKKVVHLLRTFLGLPGTPLLIAQGEQSIYAAMQEYNSWVVVDWQQKQHFKFEAIAYIVSLSPIFSPLAILLKWRPIMTVGTKFYEMIAANRQFAGKFTAYLKFSPLNIYPSKLMNIVPLIILMCVIIFESSSLFIPNI